LYTEIFCKVYVIKSSAKFKISSLIFYSRFFFTNVEFNFPNVEFRASEKRHYPTFIQKLTYWEILFVCQLIFDVFLCNAILASIKYHQDHLSLLKNKINKHLAFSIEIGVDVRIYLALLLPSKYDFNTGTKLGHVSLPRWPHGEWNSIF